MHARHGPQKQVFAKRENRFNVPATCTQFFDKDWLFWDGGIEHFHFGMINSIHPVITQGKPCHTASRSIGNA